MKVTMQQLADKVGVSKMAISLYLRDTSTNRISESIKEKIEQAMAELGYEPPLNCQFKDGKKIVAILLPFNMPIFKYELIDDYLNGIQDSLFSNGYDFIFLRVSTNRGVPVIDKTTLMKCRSFSGVILFGTRYTQEKDLVDALSVLKANKIPTILLNYPNPLNGAIQGLNIDDSTCAPIEYLISLGHKRIIFMGGTKGSAHTEYLFKEYKASLKKAKIEFDEELVLNGEFEGYKAFTELDRIIKSGVKFSAIFCMSTQMVIGCYRALKENNLRIPEDVSVLNYGDPYFTEFLDPPLSTVHLPLNEIGADCAKYLDSIISEGIFNIDYKVIRHNALVIRKSVSVFKE